MHMVIHIRHGSIELPLVIVALIITTSIAVLFLTFSASIAAQTQSYVEEHSQSDTTLYVLLNNNELIPNTDIPLKYILGIAIANGNTNAATPITLNYNDDSDTVDIESLIVSGFNILGIEEYYFYVMYGTDKIMEVKSLTYSSNSTEEIEYISVPPDEIATAVLKISKIEYPDDVENCPNDSFYTYNCYPRLTCEHYFGNCVDAMYSCGINQCCCEDATI